MIHKLKDLFFGTLIFFIIISCTEEDTSDSFIGVFPDYSVTLVEAIGVEGNGIVDEISVIDTVKLVMPMNSNIIDVTLNISGSSASEAIEGEDFTITTPTIDVTAFDNDTILIEIAIIRDGVEEDDEDIILTVEGEYGSPVASDFNVGTILDNGFTKSRDVDFTLSWGFDGDAASLDPCIPEIDYDLYIYSSVDFNVILQAATLDCPESSTLNIDDMVEGELYYIYAAAYNVFEGGIIDMYLEIEYNRPDTEFTGILEIPSSVGFTSATFDGAANFVTIELSGEDLIMRDLFGDILVEGRSYLDEIGNIDSSIFER